MPRRLSMFAVLALLGIPLGCAKPSAEPAQGEAVSRPLAVPFNSEEAQAAQAAWAQKLEKQVVEKNSLGMELVLIPPGSFKMGSPPNEKDRDDDEQQVDVTLTQPFYLGKTEVTQGQWIAVMGTQPWQGEEHVKEGANYAASWMSWEEATEFCLTLNESERRAGRLPAGWEYALPSEAQWEYACRAGTTTRFYFGDDESQLNDYAWWGGLMGYGNAKNEQYAHEVGQKRPNAFGLHDMHGNVREWCRDCYKRKLPGGNDPLVTRQDSLRVYRGGSWILAGWTCRSAYRGGLKPGDWFCCLGFRLALVPEPVQGEAAPWSFNSAEAQAAQTAWAQKLKKQVVEKNTLGMELVLIPPGSFKMGSPPNEKDRNNVAYLGSNEDQVDVTLTKPFYLGKTEVTQGQWTAVMGTRPWQGDNISHVKEGENYAASFVSWKEATEFCLRLTESERRAGRLPAGWEYALPSEAQWEYACRAGTTTRFYFGDDESQLSDYAWWGGLRENGNAKNEQYAHEVGQKRPNAFGLHDMHGNVWEWCEDWYDWKLPGGTDPLATRQAEGRVRRGGCWCFSAGDCRSAIRGWLALGNRFSDLGFRLALVQVEGEESLAAKAAQAAWAQKLEKQVVEKNTLDMELVLIPPGSFIMGSPEDDEDRYKNEQQVEVTLAKPFYLGKTEVTQEQWTAVMGTEPWVEHGDKDYYREGANYPAMYVSWDDAQDFCKKLTESERRAGRLPAGWEYALPSEAQWEYACRAGTTTRFCFGDDESPLGQYDWFEKNTWEVAQGYAHEVGQKRANAFGLHDMHGNVGEWCADWYSEKLPGGTDPLVTQQASFRVCRGGYWEGSARDCRSAVRGRCAPGHWSGGLGFRVALVPVDR